MKFKLFKAKLCTGGKTADDIISDFEGDVSEEEIRDWQHALNLIDGKEIIVTKILKDRYTLVSWMDEDDEAFRDYIYQAEQDDMFGTYIDDREEFLKDWKNEVYEPTGSLGFDKKDVEIIEELKKQEAKE